MNALNDRIRNLLSSSEPTLADAIMLATICHNKQTDKSGKPYILHPLRVLHKVMTYTDDIITHFLAIFHDLIEDCSDIISINDLIKLGYPNELINELLLMTKYKHDTYLGTYIPRICRSYRCTLVKKVDVEHNTKIQRMHNWNDITDKDIKRIEKYYRAYQTLCKTLDEYERTNTTHRTSGYIGMVTRFKGWSCEAAELYIFMYTAQDYIQFLERQGADVDDRLALSKYIAGGKFIKPLTEIINIENLTNHCISVITEDTYDDNLIFSLANLY